MGVEIETFDLGKGFSSDRISSFFKAKNLDSNQIINTNFAQRGKDNITFTVIYNDTKAPFVVSTVPGDDAVSVALNQDIIIQFSEDMSTILPSDLLITRGGLVVDPTGFLDQSDLSRLIISSVIDGTQSIPYVVTVFTTVKDVAGNFMENPSVFNFTTGAVGAGTQILEGFHPLTGPDIGLGYVDITLPSGGFTANDYKVAPSINHASDIGDMHISLRTSNLTSTTFRMHFDQATATTITAPLVVAPITPGVVLQYIAIKS